MISQLSFSDSEEQARLERLRSRNKLLQLNKHINWEIFRPIIKNALKHEPKGPGGRPAFDELMKFKMLILGRIYNLSDAELEFQVEDRTSFRDFLGLRAGDKVPDEKTIWEYREKLTKAGAMKKLFGRFDAVLHHNALILNDGRIVDAEIIEAPKRHLKKEEKEQLKESSDKPIPEQNTHRRSQIDMDAGWTFKHGRRYFGYKNTAKIDKGSKLILGYHTTNASVHDSQSFSSVLDKEQDKGQPIFADKGYWGQKCFTEVIRTAGKEMSRIMHKAKRGTPITEEQKQENKQWAKTRSRIEHVFAHKKYVLNFRLIRRKGLKRADFEIGLGNLVYNLQRFCFLISESA
jgi:IS5 family transposase